MQPDLGGHVGFEPLTSPYDWLVATTINIYIHTYIHVTGMASVFLPLRPVGRVTFSR